MSSSVDVRQRSGIWSYLPFNSNNAASSATPRNRRTSSVSLPSSRAFGAAGGARPDRYGRSGRLGPMYANKSGYMHNRQRLRMLKAGAVIAFIFLFLFFLVPGEREALEKYVGGTAITLCFLKMDWGKLLTLTQIMHPHLEAAM